MTRRTTGIVRSLGALAVATMLVAACNSDADSNSITDTATGDASPVGDPTAAGTVPVDSVAAAEAASGQTTPSEGAPVELGPLGSTEVELESDVGDVQIGSGDIPELVPAAFPVPDDLVVQLSSETGSDAGFTGLTQLAFDEIVEFYLTGLAETGYRTTEQQLIPGSIAVYSFEGSDGHGQVAISVAPGGTGRNVIVTYTR